jgi:hypothetical protein
VTLSLARRTVLKGRIPRTELGLRLDLSSTCLPSMHSASIVHALLRTHATAPLISVCSTRKVLCEEEDVRGVCARPQKDSALFLNERGFSLPSSDSEGRRESVGGESVVGRRKTERH